MHSPNDKLLDTQLGIATLELAQAKSKYLDAFKAAYYPGRRVKCHLPQPFGDDEKDTTLCVIDHYPPPRYDGDEEDRVGLSIVHLPTGTYCFCGEYEPISCVIGPA